MSIYLFLFTNFIVWRAILAYGYPWDPEIVIVNKPTITQNDGVYRRIRYGYYTFPSSVQYNTWGPSPHNPPNAPWPPNPPWPPSSPSWPSSSWQSS